MLILKRLGLGLIAAAAAAALAACNLGDVAGAVPTTGDTAGDAAAAQRFLPSVPGYVITEANSITGALSAVTGGAAALTGDPIVGAAIAAVDGLIQCYNSVGAAAARVYIQEGAEGMVMNGATPRFGAMAVINGNRLVNNFLPCALGQVGAMSAQTAQQPEICSSNGSFTVGSDTLYYLYASNSPELCSTFQAAVPAS
jgi:hypothetical protein